MQLKAISDLLESLVNDQTVPGCAISIRHSGSEILCEAYGQSEVRPNPRLTTTNTIWDLASLTKVICTAHLYLVWANNGQITLDDEICKLLPHAPEGVTIAHCLSHSSGYPNWRPFYARFSTNIQNWGTPSIRERMLHTVSSTPLDKPPGSHYAYSDIGFMTLCAYAEVRFGKPIHLLWQEYLPEDARRGLYWGHPDAAATEDCPVRRTVLKGQVHDLNAAVLGGKSTHAGLFGSVSSLTNAAQWSVRCFQGLEDSVEADIIKYFWSFRGAGTHCLGWDTPSPSGSSASKYWPLDGIGHLGFTGTSLWISPNHDLIVGFCSNRVHPTIEGGAIPNATIGPKTKSYRSFRPNLHKLVVHSLGL